MDPVQPSAEDLPEYDVFLSYASEDRAWCERLVERLRDDGIRVWVDFRELQPGDHLQARINEGLERSRKLVALFSKSYFRARTSTGRSRRATARSTPMCSPTSARSSPYSSRTARSSPRC